MSIPLSTLLLAPRLADLKSSLDHVLEDFEREKLPTVLYHYTNWDGFCGIVQDQRFWATDHHDTNDPNELQSADKLIMATARRLQGRLPRGTIPGLDWFIRRYGKTRARDLTPVYLTCFSRTHDNQHLWKEYADSGRGVCLGIRILDEKLVDEHGTRLGRGFSRVRYSENEWKTEVETAFQRVQEVYLRYTNSQGRLSPREADIATYTTLAVLAAVASCSIKLPKWEKEDEWRQVAVPGYGYKPTVLVKTRKSGGGEVRYLSLRGREQGRLMALSKVLLGPECPRTASDVQDQLAAVGYGDEMPPVVRWSPCPE